MLVGEQTSFERPAHSKAFNFLLLLQIEYETLFANLCSSIGVNDLRVMSLALQWGLFAVRFSSLDTRKIISLIFS